MTVSDVYKLVHKSCILELCLMVCVPNKMPYLACDIPLIFRFTKKDTYFYAKVFHLDVGKSENLLVFIKVDKDLKPLYKELPE